MSKKTVKKSVKKPKTHNVMAWVRVLVGIDVPSATFEEALEKAKKMRSTDFVTIKGDYLDDKPVYISGVYAGDPE